METEPQPHLSYPPIEAHDTVHDYHGTEVPDPYGWMVDLQNPTVQTWIDAQNTLTENWLRQQAGLETVHAQFSERTDKPSHTAASMFGDTYFWHEREPGQHTAILYRGPKPLDKTSRKVALDPHTFSHDGSLVPATIEISPTGTHILYSLQKSGSETHHTYIRNVETGHDRYFRSTYFAEEVWDYDGQGFYYTTHATSPQDLGYPRQSKVYYHKLGSRKKDTLIFDAEALTGDPRANPRTTEYNEGEHIVVEADCSGYSAKIFLISKSDGTTREILPDAQGDHEVRIRGSEIFVLTDYQASKRQILYSQIDQADAPAEEWATYLAESADAVIEDLYLFGQVNVVEYAIDGSSRVDILDCKTGDVQATLDLPPFSQVSDIAPSSNSKNIEYSITNFLTPHTRYSYNLKSGHTRVLWKDERTLDEAEYETRQEWYTAQDGTSIPMFITQPKNVESGPDNPTLMYGYGGFNEISYPTYKDVERVFLEHGGTIVAPGIRGGGEFGLRWHEAGMKRNKQTSFNDFISAAEHLINNGYTSPEKLAITGDSNGGLLVAGVMMQRPELFKAVYCDIPLIDMVDFPNHLMGDNWIPEYGDPNDPDDFQALHALSPYHNIITGKTYPNMLLHVGLNDSRVHPLHSLKLAARLQAETLGQTLLHANRKAGHNSGANFYDELDVYAMTAAFILHHLGVRINEQD